MKRRGLRLDVRHPTREMSQADADVRVIASLDDRMMDAKTGGNVSIEDLQMPEEGHRPSDIM